eukprot:1085783-Ditylum_brightwellii.AAC.1
MLSFEDLKLIEIVLKRWSIERRKALFAARDNQSQDEDEGVFDENITDSSSEDVDTPGALTSCSESYIVGDDSKSCMASQPSTGELSYSTQEETNPMIKNE